MGKGGKRRRGKGEETWGEEGRDVVGIHSAMTLGYLTKQRDASALPTDPPKGKWGLVPCSLALALAWMGGAEQVASYWCSFPLARTTAVASNLSCISERSPLLHI